MIGVWVKFLHKLVFVEVEIDDVVDIVVFSPLNVVLHHGLDICYNKFSGAAEPEQVEVILVADFVELNRFCELLDDAEHLLLLFTQVAHVATVLLNCILLWSAGYTQP